MKILSVAIPCYNSESYMEKCIKSILPVGEDVEILIVDEVLSVGDASFQEKSRNRMMELMSGGTTVLFVSHSTQQIRDMCDRVVWLDHGKIKMIGTAAEVCDAYEGKC